MGERRARRVRPANGGQSPSASAQGTDLCALSVLCVRKKSHAESAEIAEELGLGGVEIVGR